MFSILDSCDSELPSELLILDDRHTSKSGPLFIVEILSPGDLMNPYHHCECARQLDDKVQ